MRTAVPKLQFYIVRFKMYEIKVSTLMRSN